MLLILCTRSRVYKLGRCSEGSRAGSIQSNCTRTVPPTSLCAVRFTAANLRGGSQEGASVGAIASPYLVQPTSGERSARSCDDANHSRGTQLHQPSRRAQRTTPDAPPALAALPAAAALAAADSP